MNNARREGTLYGDSWKKDVNEAFAASKVNGLGDAFNSMFTDFKVIDSAPLPGFRRFDFAAAFSNHPSFKEGQLYAVPLRDGNKSVQTLEGATTIYPKAGELLTFDSVSRLLEDAIEEEFEARGMLSETVVLGAFSRAAIATDFKRGEMVQKAVDSPGKHHFALFHGDEVLETFSIEYSEVGEGEDPFKAAMITALAKVPDYYPGAGVLDDQKPFTVCEINPKGISVLEHLTEIKYDYTARLYDVSGEPDGWGFFGIPAK